MGPKNWRRERDSNPLENVNSTTCKATDGIEVHGKQQ
jgi:hypothetical protein